MMVCSSIVKRWPKWKNNCTALQWHHNVDLLIDDRTEKRDFLRPVLRLRFLAVRSSSALPCLDVERALGNMESDTDAENEINTNAGIMSTGAGTFYITSCVIVSVVLSFVVLNEDSTTNWALTMSYLNVAHGLITLYALHWTKGSVVEADQGEYDELTWWEQVDGGIYWTKTKRFLTIVPCVIFYITMHIVHRDITEDVTLYYKYMLVNAGVTLVVLVPKMPFMHKARVFGINKTKYD